MSSHHLDLQVVNALTCLPKEGLSVYRIEQHYVSQGYATLGLK